MQSIEELQTIEELGEKALESVHCYRLRLAEASDFNAVNAAIAKAIVDAGADLYRLQTEHRDLESLFREVSEAPITMQPKEKLNDAA